MEERKLSPHFSHALNLCSYENKDKGREENPAFFRKGVNLWFCVTIVGHTPHY